jgi:ubiquinone/menaquinone biosynthesis C-methylase UbiE
MGPGYDIEQLQALEDGWFFYDHAWSLLLEIIRSIEGDSILDVGCGTGVALSIMKALFPWRKCRGIDPSADATPIWQARGLEVDIGSATHLPYPDCSWDSVFTSHVMEHVDDDQKALREIVRVTRRRAIIVVPDGDAGAKNFGTPHLRTYNRVNFKTLIEGSAGKDFEIKIYSLPHIHMSNLIAILDRRGMS